MKLRFGTALLALSAFGCSGSSPDSLGKGSESPVITGDTNPAVVAPVQPTPLPLPVFAPHVPKRASLEAAGGSAQSANHRLHFRVVAPVLAMGASSAKGAVR